MEKKFSEMSVEKLDDVLQALGDKIRALRVVRHGAKAEWNNRQVDIAAEKLVAKMSDGERVKVAQILKPEGIATTGRVGKPKRKS